MADSCHLPQFIVVEAGRILYCRLVWCGVRMQVWVVYSPTNTKKSVTKDEFYRKLQKSFQEQGKLFKNWPRLIISDLNSTMGPDAPFSKYLGKNCDKYPTTDNGLRLAQFLVEEKVYALNTLFEHGEKHRVTFKLGKIRKRLDYVIADRWFKLNCTNARAYPAQSHVFESNHRLMMAEFILPSKKQRQTIFVRHEPKPRPLLTSLRDDPVVVAEYSACVDENLPILTETEKIDLDINEITTRLMNSIQTAAAEKIPGRDPDFTEWMTTEYSDLILKHKTMKKRKQKRKIAKKLKKLRLKLRNEFFTKRANSINNAHEQRKIEEEYRVAKSVKMLSKSTANHGCLQEEPGFFLSTQGEFCFYVSARTRAFRKT